MKQEHPSESSYLVQILWWENLELLLQKQINFISLQSININLETIPPKSD